MKNTLNLKRATRLAVCLTVLLVGGCDYMPNEVFEIETTDGKIIKLLCPVVDRDRSKFSYFIDGECVALSGGN